MTEEQSQAQNQLSGSFAGDKTTIGLGFGAALELPPGRIIADRYRVIEEIGRGGMGVVYRVEQILLGREMALKTLDGQDVKDATWRRFQQEAKATSMLDHTNLISVHDSGMIDGKHPYFVMDLVLGTTLAKLIAEKGPLSVEEALPIFIQVCFGLSYAHELGIVHRDLKPSNIMLVKPPGGGPYTAKIVDFGIAKLHLGESADVQGLTKTGEIFGSPLYMSPEQCLGIAVDHRSDIYALGCVFFEALTGLPPFMGTNSLSTMMKHQSEKAPTLKEATLGKEFPKDIEFLVAKLLEKEPENRYQSLQTVAHDLSLLQQGISAQSLTGSASIGISRTPAQETKLPILRTLAACLVSAAIGAAFAWIIKDQLDDKIYSAKIAELMKKYDQKAPVQLPFTPIKEVVQSTKFTDRNGKNFRRIYFIRPIGSFNIVGERAIYNATGIHKIPFEKSIHLTIKDPDCLDSTDFFEHFQPGDVTELSLNSNYGITDKSLKSIGHLSSLTFLNLADTDASDESLKYLNQLHSLRSLFVGYTRVTEDGVLSLNRLNQFNDLAFSGMPSVSRILKKLTTSKSLTTLVLDKCRLTTDQLKEIATIKSLVELSVDENQAVDDNSLKLLTALPNLERLSLAATSVTSASIDSFKQFPRLKRILIGINQWSTQDMERFKAANPNIVLNIEFRDKDVWK